MSDIDSFLGASNPSDFAKVYGGAAKRAGDQIGVDPNVLLGQWGHETGWGKSVIPGTNNLGNIKDFSGGGVAATDNMTGSQDKYRAFNSPDEFADHYAGLINRKYQGAVGAGADAAKFAGAMKAGGYAEDPNYAAKIQAAANTVSRASNPVLKAANAVTDAIFPSANAATPSSIDAFLDAPIQKSAPQPAAKARQSPAPAGGVDSFLDTPATAKPTGMSMTTDINGNPLPQRTVSFLHGAMDPVAAASQLVSKVLPDSVNNTIAGVANWASDKTGGMLPRMPEGGIDAEVERREQAYEQGRAANGETGIDGYRALGNILSPINAVAAARVPQAAGILGRIGIGAASGATSGALTPVASDDFWTDKAKQTGLGAAVGGAVPAIASVIGRAVSPNASVNPRVQLLKDEGIAPTIGQTLGGWANATEEKLQGLPLMGDMIRRARGQARDEFNNAAINRATAPIGVKVDGIGHEGVDAAHQALSNAYDNLLTGMTFRPDQQMVNDLSRIAASHNLRPQETDMFNSLIKGHLDGFGQNGTMSGKDFKVLESSLRNDASNFSGATDGYQKKLGSALNDALDSFRSGLTRSNPNEAPQLKKINEGWANLVRVENAANRGIQKEGVFTPGQLNQAVRATDRSARDNVSARGQSLMQDLGKAGQTVLGDKIPDSGTAGRMMWGAGALASGILNPAIPAALLGGGALYTRPIQSLMNAAVSARPAIAQPAAEALRQLSPSAAPLLAPAAVGVALDRKDKRPGYADGGMLGDDDEAEVDSGVDGRRGAAQAQQQAEYIQRLAAHTARQNEKVALDDMGEDTDALGYKNGGMIGAPAMSGAIKALAFGKSQRQPAYANGGLLGDDDTTSQPLPDISPTPVKSGIAKVAADSVRAVSDFASKPFGYDNPPGKMLSGALGLPAIADTLDNVAYGSRVTTGAGQATRMRPETAEAAMAVAPMIPGMPGVAGAAREAAGEAGSAIGRVAKAAYENAGAVPAVRGPLAQQDGIIRYPFNGEPTTAAEKAQLSRYMKSLENPGVRFRENLRGDGQTIMDQANIGQRQVINPEDWVGKTLVPVVGDTTLTGGALSQINGVPLSRKVLVQGGPDFPMQQTAQGGDAGWASMLTAASSKQNNLTKAAEATGRDVIGVYSAMSPDSINFSAPTAEAMLAQIPNLKIAKPAINAVNKEIQAFRPDFLGVTHPEVFDQIKGLNGHPIDGAGDLRKQIIAVMGKAKYRDMGFPVYDDVANAVTSPNLRGLNVGDSGYAAFNAQPGRSIEPFVGHESYNTKIPGTYAGGLEDHIPAPIMFPKTFDTLRSTLNKNGSPLPIAEQLGSLRARHLWEPADQQWLDGVMGYLGK